MGKEVKFRWEIEIVQKAVKETEVVKSKRQMKCDVKISVVNPSKVIKSGDVLIKYIFGMCQV